jgi:hypothetical protein
VSIKIRVRATPESFMGDTEVKHQRHRTRRIREVTGQLDVPKTLTPTSSHLLRFHFVFCVENCTSRVATPKTRANENIYKWVSV